MNVLTIKNLGKNFSEHQVIQNLMLNVPEHSIYGFIGKNGSGKTTTMKMVLGLLKPDKGSIEVCGESVRYGNTRTNRFIGYLPDVPEFYDYMTSLEYLRLCSEISGIPQRKITIRSEELLELVGLSSVKKRIGTFSRGMKQRLGIAQALINEPKLLICDEPTSALDPVGRIEILEILSRVRGKTTVIFSTHILSDVERICDHVGILNEGNIAVSGEIDDLKNLHRQDRLAVYFSKEEELQAYCSYAQNLPRNNDLLISEKCIIIKSLHIENTMVEVMQELVDLHLSPIRIEILEPTLENLFLEVVQ